VRGDIWSGFDVLWVGLAVVTAYRIPQVPRSKRAPEFALGESGPPTASVAAVVERTDSGERLPTDRSGER
jgi:hypothetical protein